MKANRLYPSLGNHSYLVLNARRKLFEAELEGLKASGREGLFVLDVGGHEKPYAPLFAPVAGKHLSLDLDGRKADVVGRAEDIPLEDDSVDIVICTQVLEHVEAPAAVVKDIHRVLKPGAIAYVSAPAIFPLHGSPADNWRFMRGGLELLFSDFSEVSIRPEGGTVASFFRTLNMYLWVFTGRRWGRFLRPLLKVTLIPLDNLLGGLLDRAAGGGEQFASNWFVKAVK